MFPDKYQEWCIRYGQKGCKFYEICSLFVGSVIQTLSGSYFV